MEMANFIYLQIEKLEYYQELSKFTIEKFIYGN